MGIKQNPFHGVLVDSSQQALGNGKGRSHEVQNLPISML